MQRFVLILTIVLLFSTPSFACSLLVHDELQIDANSAPIEFREFKAEVAGIYRGVGPSSSNCDDVGNIHIELSNTNRGIGYRMEIVDGEAPNFYTLELLTPHLPHGDMLYLSWGDGVPEDQTTIDFTLRIIAVGPDGTEGPVRDLEIYDAPDHSDGGCATTGSRNSSLFSLLLVGALIVLRRRK